MRRSPFLCHSTILAIIFALSCSSEESSWVKADGISENAATTVKSLIPEARLAKIKGALPQVRFPKLKQVLKSSQTLWYDHETMTPTYQDSVGVNSNADWPRLVASTPATNPAIRGLHDARNKRWQFPFSVTAGTDASTNVKVVNFIHLPHIDGKPLSIPIWTIRRNANRPSWMWVYPIGTMVGEIIFLEDSGNLLPSEIRTRQRFASGWATNIFRPFPTANVLAAAIKSRRPNWQSQPNLAGVVNHLENGSTLRSDTLAASGALSNTFQQTAGVDQLPDFNDQALVKELLEQTPFVSSYGRTWKANGGLKSYAPTATSSSSIVPKGYQGGFLEVNDQSCMRCHKDAGRRVSEFYDGLYLYGEVWGKDGIFSFHPFDESEFSRLRRSGGGADGYYDNRKINPALSAMGIFERYDAAKHNSPQYPERTNP